jgi:hypothetical protein
MAHIRYYTETSAFAHPVYGALDLDQTTLSLMAAKTSKLRLMDGFPQSMLTLLHCCYSFFHLWAL